MFALTGIHFDYDHLLNDAMNNEICTLVIIPFC